MKVNVSKNKTITGGAGILDERCRNGWAGASVLWRGPNGAKGEPRASEGGREMDPPLSLSSHEAATSPCLQLIIYNDLEDDGFLRGFKSSRLLRVSFLSRGDQASVYMCQPSLVTFVRDSDKIFV